MAVRNTILGGTAWSDGEVLTVDDLNDTYDLTINSYKELNIQRYGDSVITGCLIEEQSTPDQTAKMSAGTIIISGVYYSINADASISFTNADGSNPRYDLVSVDSVGNVTVTDGTAAASPSMPSLPADNVPLAYVYRAASDNTINSADITDCRRLVDIDFEDYSNSRSVQGASTWSTAKIITVPAFRCQKQLIVQADLAPYCNSILDGGALGTSNTTISLRLRINGVVYDTRTLNYRKAEVGGTEKYIFQFGDSGAFKWVLDENDVTFTDIITLDVQIIGSSNFFGSGDNLEAVNQSFSVVGR